MVKFKTIFDEFLKNNIYVLVRVVIFDFYLYCDHDDCFWISEIWYLRKIKKNYYGLLNY